MPGRNEEQDPYGIRGGSSMAAKRKAEVPPLPPVKESQKSEQGSKR